MARKTWTIELDETSYVTIEATATCDRTWVSGVVVAMTGSPDVRWSAWKLNGSTHTQRGTTAVESTAVISSPEYAEAVATAAEFAQELTDKWITDQAADAAFRVRMAARVAEAESVGTPGFFRFGMAPKNGHSHNNRDNCGESGVSCYPGWLMPDGSIILDGTGIDTTSALFIQQRGDVYRINGEVVGSGADGEPVLRVASSRKIIPSPDTAWGMRS